MALGMFDWEQARQLGAAIEYAYHLYDVATENHDQFPQAALPPGYAEAEQIFVDDSFITNNLPESRREDLLDIFNLNKPIGVIAVSEAAADVIVAFRGTQTAFEWLHDAEFFHAEYPFVPSGGRTEFGFTMLYASCKTGTDDSSPRVADALKAYAPGRSVQITGHSLGAALATLLAPEAALTLRDLVRKDSAGRPLLSVLTLGSPLVGDKTFAGMFDALLPNSWRVANRPDIAPQLPPPFAGYAHVAAEFPVNSGSLTRQSLACWHALETYLYLLSPGIRTLQPECLPQQP